MLEFVLNSDDVRLLDPDLKEKIMYSMQWLTTTELASAALSMIQDRKGQYDLVIAEINMPEMHGFIFLKRILLQFDIPIICE
ncbi:hypothetical protein LguiA_000612 [Lonicera macranthoides]